jgi:deoxyribodipyrimidine photolyase-like uncharacterized protein
MFLSPDDWIEDVMGGMKKPFMKTFYEAQRKRMNILLRKGWNTRWRQVVF